MVPPFFATNSGSGGSGGVTSVNGLTGALTLVAGSGISITPSGSNITIAATGGGSTWQSTEWSSTDSYSSATTSQGALPTILGDSTFAQSFQILTSDVTNDSDTPQNLFIGAGSSTSSTSAFSGASVFINSGVGSGDNTSGGSISIAAGNGSGVNANGGNALFQAGSGLSGDAIGGVLSFISGAGVGTGAAGDLNLVGGTASAQGGNINLIPGAGTPSGAIKFQTATPAVVGQVWTATNTDGSGNWASAGGGSAIPNNAASYQLDNSGGTSPGTWLYVGDETASFNTNSYYTLTHGSFGTSPSTFTAPATGTYRITGAIQIIPSADSWIVCEVAYLINPTSAIPTSLYNILGANGVSSSVSGLSRLYANGSQIVQLTAGDIVGFSVFQDNSSAGNRNFVNCTFQIDQLV